MFPFFSKKSLHSSCPVPPETRLWVDAKFKWLIDTFGEQTIRHKKILIPHYSDFPFDYNGSLESAVGTLAIIASQLDLNVAEIDLFVLAEDVNTEKSLGQGKGNKNYVGLEKQKLTQPENLIATLARELAHIKLLTEGKQAEDDERMTDMVTVLFGLGIFNANAAFRTFSGMNYTSWLKMDSLSRLEWGYALALLAQWRQEDNSWMEHLSVDVKSDFKKSMKWLTTYPQSL
jgi:hypothetical protein